MQKGQIMLQNIRIDLLVAHPENSNYMKVEKLRKLRQHIDKTGRYEPLTVRPHPGEGGKFQVINGHNRLRVLSALNYQTAHCVVWDLDDNQTRLYLATLNRLSGSEIPERRAALLENLLVTFDANELSTLLPDNRKQLEELKRLSQIEPNEFKGQSTFEDKLNVPVVLSFVLEESEAKEVNLALDLTLSMETVELSRSQALVHITRFYLKHCKPIVKRNISEKQGSL